MKVGIIGYGSMGKMLLWKFSESGRFKQSDLLISNRTPEKLAEASAIASVCTNRELARNSDIVFVCVRPADLKTVLTEIKPDLDPEALLVSLNGSVTFEMIHQVIDHKTAKVIPSLTAEINRSQTLVCYNSLVELSDKGTLEDLLHLIGEVIELPENEIGMGSELVSCMPGFIASIFDVICRSAQDHTEIPHEQIVRMVLNTLSAAGDLMLQKGLTFEEVVSRVATPGGITEEGTKVIYEMMPQTADALFEKTLAKRRSTAERAAELFSEA